MPGQHSVRDFDWPLIGLALAIATMGVLEIYSATRNTVWQDAHYRQIVWIIAGFILMWIVSIIDYNWLVDHVYIFYAVGLVGLVAVALFGHVGGGARRWIALPGGVLLQVSEFLKVVLVLLVARFLADMTRERLNVANLLQISGLFALAMALVAMQPDLKTALSYVPILAMGVVLVGLRWKYVAVLAVASILIVPLTIRSLKPYQKERLVAFMNPDKDPRGSGYQPIQSQIAVGSGGIWGKGFALGTQTQLRFLPVPHTDFIFSAWAEETGFVGVVRAMARYFARILKIVSTAQTAADNAGTFICMGVAAVILFHLFVNVGMVIGRMPVTGIPLPLMSYGGSNTLTTFMFLGLVNNVRLRRFTN
jgi:rod shape determining protein RodA